MFPLPNSYGLTARPSGTIPTQSISLVRASSQYLSMSDANFGAYDRAKWAISTWVKRASTGATMGIMNQLSAGGGQRAFQLIFTGANKINIATYVDGTVVDGELITTATYTNTSAYYHILFWYDSANATAGDRMRLWVNGVEVTLFDTDTNPTAAIFNSTTDVGVGDSQSSGGSPNDGLIFQNAFFSGYLPTVSQVYNAGSPLPVTNITGLWSVLDVAGGDVTSDGVLVAAWTNNNGATASSTIPV